jgi:nitrite reductase/ring-hydroxylating ferredoxin subunit
MATQAGAGIGGDQSRGPVPYSGYFLRTVPAEDGELTHTGPGTRMGELMRRFWQPVCLSSEISDLPKAIRILGEDLVAYRDKAGTIGLLHRHCSHRGTSLEYGIVGERGLRCCYHGWLFDADGSVLETPGEPSDSRLRQTIRHGAYPAREHRGLIFAYLGPPQSVPPFPLIDTCESAETRLAPYSVWHDCNWLQVQENIMDPVHACFLHTTMSNQQLSPAFTGIPELEFHETDGGTGMLFVTSRRIGDHVWVRTNHAILPNFLQIGPIFPKTDTSVYFARAGNTRWCVPIDDHTCWIIGWRHFGPSVDANGDGREHLCGPNSIDLFGQDGNRTYEARQREPGDWEALTGQRSIAVHALEHLGWTDRGVVMLRRLLREAVRNESADAVARAQIPNGSVINTHTQDAVLRLPASAADDRAFLNRTGEAVVEIVTGSASLQGAARRAHIEERYRALETTGN